MSKLTTSIILTVLLFAFNPIKTYGFKDNQGDELSMSESDFSVETGLSGTRSAESTMRLCSQLKGQLFSFENQDIIKERNFVQVTITAEDLKKFAQVPSSEKMPIWVNLYTQIEGSLLKMDARIKELEYKLALAERKSTSKELARLKGNSEVSIKKLNDFINSKGHWID